VNNYFEEKFKKKEKGLTVKELQTQIDALLAQLGSLQKQLSKLGG